jgi:hypothetical protein
MTELPVAELFSVQHANGPTRFSVRCPHCRQIHSHSHRHFGQHAFVDLTAPCSTHRSVRRYRVQLDRDPAGQGRDDNAIDVPVPNWEE